MTLSPVDPAALLRPLLLFVGLLIALSAPKSDDDGPILAGAAGCLGVGAVGAKAAKGCGTLGKTASLAGKAGTAAKATAVGAAGAHLVDDAARVGVTAAEVGDDAARVGAKATEGALAPAEVAEEGVKADELVEPIVDVSIELLPEEEEGDEDAP